MAQIQADSSDNNIISSLNQGISDLNTSKTPNVVIPEFFDAPWKCCFDPIRGRYLIAKNDFKAGDLVLSEIPYSFVPFGDSQSQPCYVCCNVSNSPDFCKSCRQVAFCSSKCKNLWIPIHDEFECKMHQKLSSIATKDDIDPNLLKLAFRIVVVATIQHRLRSSDEQFKASKKYSEYNDSMTISSGSFELVMSLVSHMENYRDSAWASAVRSGVEQLFPLVPGDLNLSIDDIISICARLNSNAHGIWQLDQTVAFGLFPIMSLMNHACNPNTTFAAIEGSPSLYCRATRNIKAGEELNVCYVDLYQTRAARQEDLQKTKFFKCQCARCTEKLDDSIDALIEGVTCSKKQCKGTLVVQDQPEILQNNNDTSAKQNAKAKGKSAKKKVTTTPTQSTTSQEDTQPIKIYKCNQCQLKCAARIIEEKVEKANNLYNSALAFYEQKGATNAQQAKTTFEQLISQFAASTSNFSLQFGEYHWIVFNSYHKLSNCCIRLGDILGSIRYLKLVSAASERILPENDPEIANYYFSLGESIQQLEKQGKIGKAALQGYLETKKMAFTKAYQIRTIALGPNHYNTKMAAQFIK